MYNANTNEQILNQIRKLEEEEYYAKLKLRGVNAEFRQEELKKLEGGPNSKDPLSQTIYDTRSKRLNSTMRGEDVPASMRSHMSGAAPLSQRALSHASRVVS